MERYQYPFQSYYTTIEGVRIHYVDEGQGDPVLMVHGQPTWSYLWRNIIPVVAKSHRAIALDLMGFGLSDKPQDRQYSFDEHTRILREFIEALELKNLTLVLHDWGGPIGLEYAVYHQENVKKLVLLNTLATVDFKLPWVFKAAFRSPFLSDFLVRRLNVFGLLAFRFGVRHSLSKQALQNYREPHSTYASRKGVAQFPRLIPASPRDATYAPIKAISQALANFPIPTLFLFSDGDPVTARIDARPVIEGMPSARLAVVKDAGHYLQEDQPEEVARNILEFLDETEPSPTSTPNVSTDQ